MFGVRVISRKIRYFVFLDYLTAFFGIETVFHNDDPNCYIDDDNIWGCRQSTVFFPIFLLLFHTHYMFRPLGVIFRQTVYFVNLRYLISSSWGS
jgi:hypothetical protein